jgi:hypothetical protein
MSLAHSRLAVAVLPLLVCLPLVLLPLMFPVVELLLEAVLPVEVALVELLPKVLVLEVAVLVVGSTDSLDLPDCSCLLDLFDSLRKRLVIESNRSIAVRCMV